LEAEAGAENAGFVLDAALDEKVVAEDLCHRSILLEHFPTLSCVLGETVEEIESRSIWIHRVWN
jgi:hypothetical protein